MTSSKRSDCSVVCTVWELPQNCTESTMKRNIQIYFNPVLREKGLMFGPVQRVEDLLSDPQALKNGYVVDFDNLPRIGQDSRLPGAIQCFPCWNPLLCACSGRAHKFHHEENGVFGSGDCHAPKDRCGPLKRRPNRRTIRYPGPSRCFR